MHNDYGLETYIDPSHISGRADLLKEVIEKGNFLGFNNLFIETHYKPTEALTDKEQQISPDELKKMLKNTKTRLAIDYYRDDIDEIDNKIFYLLSKRFLLAEKVGEIKNDNKIPILDNKRLDAIIKAKEVLGFSHAFLKDIYNVIHKESVKKQIENGK